METEYIVMDKTAKMPASVKAQYRRVAVCEVEKGARPKMISERARGLVRIVSTYERLHVGKTAACAYHQALTQAQIEADRLNAIHSTRKA